MGGALHRITKAKRKNRIFDSKEAFEIACFLFSLLLNTTDLEATVMIFKNICFCFMYKCTSQMQQNAKDFILDSIAERPTEKEEVKSIIRRLQGPMSFDADVDTDVDAGENVDMKNYDTSKSKKSDPNSVSNLVKFLKMLIQKLRMICLLFK